MNKDELIKLKKVIDKKKKIKYYPIMVSDPVPDFEIYKPLNQLEIEKLNLTPDVAANAIIENIENQILLYSASEYADFSSISINLEFSLLSTKKIDLDTKLENKDIIDDLIIVDGLFCVADNNFWLDDYMRKIKKDKYFSKMVVSYSRLSEELSSYGYEFNFKPFGELRDIVVDCYNNNMSNDEEFTSCVIDFKEEKKL